MKKQYAVLVFFAGLITFLYSACQKNKISTEFYIKYSPNTKVGDSIYVEAASDFSGIKYFWTFGDGSTSTGKVESHVYTASGTYTITLMINNDPALTKSKTIDISSNYDFSYTGTPIPGRSISFFLKYPHGHQSTYVWDFGDGVQSTDSMPVHVYADSGKYNVTLLVNNNTLDITKKTITIINDPLYTHSLQGNKNWQGVRKEYFAYPKTKLLDTSFAINYINEVTISVGSEALIFDPSRSAGNILHYRNVNAFYFDSTDVSYNYVKDSTGYSHTYRYRPSMGSKAEYIYEYKLHTQ
jgi:chitodextrinase